MQVYYNNSIHTVGSADLTRPAIRPSPDRTNLGQFWVPPTTTIVPRPEFATNSMINSNAAASSSSTEIVENRALESNCCYSIPSSDYVTSVVAVDDNEYVFASFASGAIRVFHIASG